jgi:hypothetical protein
VPQVWKLRKKNPVVQLGTESQFFSCPYSVILAPDNILHLDHVNGFQEIRHLTSMRKTE